MDQIPIISDKIIEIIEENFLEERKESFFKCFRQLDQSLRYLFEFLSRFLILISKQVARNQFDFENLLRRFLASLTLKRVQMEQNNRRINIPLSKPDWNLIEFSDLDMLLDFFQNLFESIEVYDQNRNDPIESIEKKISSRNSPMI